MLLRTSSFSIHRSQSKSLWKTFARTLSVSIPSSYLNETIIPTYHFQKSLMRLPIPDLDKTIERYLLSVQPVVTSEEFQRTQKVAKEFQEGVGKVLHDALVQRDKDNSHTSYINAWWFDMYTSDRRPVMINHNPQLRIRDDSNPLKQVQNQRAASLIASSIKFYKTLMDEKLEPDIFHTKPKYSKTSTFQQFVKFLPESFSFYGAAACGAYPLDMSQYKNLFQSTRIPHEIQDELKTFPNSKHIIVQYGKDFFPIDVLTNENEIIPEDEILAQIDAILSKPPRLDGNGIGVLTTMDRTSWAKARKELINSSEINQHSLNMIDSALFALTLEHEGPISMVDANRCFLHGNGTNHWFDKSFQLIVDKNGQASLNFEHSWGDGVAVLRYVNEIFDDSIQNQPIISSKDSSINVQPLKWNINDSMEHILNQAMDKFNTWTSSMFVESAESTIDRSISKKYNIGIDGLLQMSIQLAHYKLHGNFVSTYESASTAAFKHGRTETIRSCTNEAVEFCQTMTNPSSSLQDKEQALRQAVIRHGELTKAGVMGQGCDRHLFGLKQMANIMNYDVPELFTMESANIMNKIILSTSTLSSHSLIGGSFGPVNDDCYAVGYGMEEETRYQLASYRKDLSQLSELLTTSLEEMVSLLKEQHKKK